MIHLIAWLVMILFFPPFSCIADRTSQKVFVAKPEARVKVWKIKSNDLYCGLILAPDSQKVETYENERWWSFDLTRIWVNKLFQTNRYYLSAHFLKRATFKSPVDGVGFLNEILAKTARQFGKSGSEMINGTGLYHTLRKVHSGESSWINILRLYLSEEDAVSFIVSEFEKMRELGLLEKYSSRFRTSVKSAHDRILELFNGEAEVDYSFKSFEDLAVHISTDKITYGAEEASGIIEGMQNMVDAVYEKNPTELKALKRRKEGSDILRQRWEDKGTATVETGEQKEINPEEKKVSKAPRPHKTQKKQKTPGETQERESKKLKSKQAP